MYTPPLNAENDLPTLQRFVRENPLCTLVTNTSKGLIATHLPIVLHETDSGFGVLRGHVARGNPQWRDFSTAEEALAIFTGPQHYITPSWYPGKHTHGKEVPTWNYVAVHAYGLLRVVDDPSWLLAHLTSLTNQSEPRTKSSWKVSDAPPEFIANQMRGIVGIEIEVSRVEGKWKVSQNRTDEEARGVIAGLGRLDTPAADVMSELVRERRPSKSTDS